MAKIDVEDRIGAPDTILNVQFTKSEMKRLKRAAKARGISVQQFVEMTMKLESQRLRAKSIKG